MLSLLVTLALGATEKPRLAVLDLQPNGAPPEVAAALTEAITQEATRRGFFEVMSSSDIRTLIGVERQKELLGCSDAATSCTAELAGALGARFVLSGSLSKLGDALQLTLQTLDTSKAQPIARSVRIASEVRELVDQLPSAVAEATATPLPQPPSRALPISLVTAGGAAIVAGAILGFATILEENGLGRDLARDPRSGEFLRFSDYQALDERLGLQRTLSLVSLIAGAALVGTGIFFFVRTPSSGASAVLVPLPNGLALAGVWP